jgi:hypothetical protein
MIPSVVEKFGYGIAVLVLFLQRRMRVGDLVLGSVDLLLGVLFIAAFLRTRNAAEDDQQRRSKADSLRKL